MAVNPRFRPIRAPLTTEGLAGTIYGTVTALAVVSAVSNYHTDLLEIALSALGTVLALSIAHGYANWIGMRAHDYTIDDFKLVVSHEWPIIAASIFVAITLYLPWLLGTSEATAVTVCLWVGVIQLFALGYRAARRAGHTLRSCLVLAFFDSLLGTVIVAIKAAVH